MAKKIAVMNDLSGFGKCSLTAAIPVLSVMGLQCCPIPTAVLTGQTGYEHYAYRDLTDMIPEYTKTWNLNNESFDGIYSGFLTGAKQADHLLAFLDSFRNEHTFLLVDPVMGDDGNVYSIYNSELLAKMKQLTKEANLITPNLMEACLLSGTSFDKVVSYSDCQDRLKAIEEIGKQIAASSLHHQEVVITGIKYRANDTSSIFNMAVSESETFIKESFFYDVSFSGTGDLFASVLCGGKVKGLSTRQSMELATKFISSSIKDTIFQNSSPQEGVEFEKHLNELL